MRSTIFARPGTNGGNGAELPYIDRGRVFNAEIERRVTGMALMSFSAGRS
jgi:hypothetical protein